MATKLKELLMSEYGSLNKFSQAAGMHPTTVSLIANGRLKPGESQKAKIVDALGWAGDADELFSAIDEDGRE